MLQWKRFLAEGLLGFFFICTSPNVHSADRVYVGEKACRECHHNAGNRNQFNQWYLSKHAKAYATLAIPEAKQIASLSGIDVDPYKSPVCMGCHATATNTEDWERDDAFYFQDGIQCEFCHGPGSEYMEDDVMRSKELAAKAGLQKPTGTFCMVCHMEKGSHIAVLKVKKFELESALQEIAHHGEGGDIPDKNPVPPTLLEGQKYAGVMACAKCHQSDKEGYAFSKWRLSKHAEAYAVLSTEKGKKIARERGVQGNPQEAPECLKCHSTAQGEPAGRFMESFDAAQGVQCESCHGPGSEYLAEAVMLDPVGARKAGLLDVKRETCLKCHPAEANGKPFDFEAEVKKIDHSRPKETKTSEAVEYKTPFNIAVSKDGTKLYVACEASDSLIVLNAQSGERLAEVKVENLPHDVCLSPDEKLIFVSNRGTDRVSVIDAQTYQIVKTIPVGDEPHHMVVSNDGSKLYTANAGSYDVSISDIQSGKEIKRLSAARGTWGMAASPDGKRIYVTNNLSHFVPFRAPSRSELTVIDTERDIIDNRIVVPETNLMEGVAVSPDGEFAVITMERTKNLVPMTRVMQGWVMTNILGIVWKNGRVDQLPLDELDNGFADPTSVGVTPDGRFAYVTSGGINVVAVVDLDRIKSILKNATDEERLNVLPNHLGISTEYVVKRIPVGTCPHGLVLSPDGRYVYVADSLDDAISVIDVSQQKRVRTFDLGGPIEITPTREGERIFHSAEVTYGRMFSCRSCHPDGGIDGLTYDIEPDGIGVNPVDNRTLRGVLDTAPFKWEGTNPSLQRQCGARLAVFFTRINPFTPDQSKKLDNYICTITRNPNRYRVEGELTPAQRKGKAIFERTHDNMRNEIPETNRCVYCHPAPYYTRRMVFDVGKGSYLDTHQKFDVPQLNNIYETAPYLHDGRAETLEEIWTRFNPRDEHGVTNDMTKDQLKDLIEYLKTL